MEHINNLLVIYLCLCLMNRWAYGVWSAVCPRPSKCWRQSWPREQLWLGAMDPAFFLCVLLEVSKQSSLNLLE